jgi:hypothetical protein
MLLPMVTAALEQILDWTPEAIGATLAGVTARIADEARAIGSVAAPEALRAKHLIGLRFPDGPPAGLVEELRAQKVFVSVRGRTVRIAPHLCCSEAVVDRLIGALRRR